MKHLKLMKTLLVAVCLFVGQSVWAETQTVKSWDFTSQSEAGVSHEAANGTVTVTVGSRKNISCNLCTTGNASGLYFWDSWKYYTTYLRNISGGDRIMVIPSLKADDVITFKSDASCIIASSNSTLGEYNSTSGTYTLTVTADGNVGIGVNKTVNIYTITVQREVEAGVCENPTYSITRANGNARTFTMACETEGSSIYYSTTELASATGGTLYSEPVETESTTIWAYAKTSEATSEVISFSTGAGSTITLNAPTITLSGIAGTAGIYFPIVTIASSQASIEVPTTATITYKFNGETIEASSPYTFTSTGTLTAIASADGYTSNSADYEVVNGYIKTKTIDLSTVAASDLSAVWTKKSDASQLPADNWRTRYDNGTFPLYIYNYNSDDASNTDVIDGLTVGISSKGASKAVTPTIYIGAGLILPSKKVDTDLNETSDWNNSINISVADGTADQIAVYTYPTNYGSSTSTKTIAANENFGLYRLSDMLTKVEVYSPAETEIIGALDKSTAASANVFGSDIVVANNSAKKLTFQNHGSSFGNNWILKFSHNDEEVTSVRADWYWKHDGEEDASMRIGSYTYGYTFSSDGGATADFGNVWANYATDMEDAEVVLNLSHIDGKVYINGTMTKDDDVYYFNYSYVDGNLTGDVTFNLSVNNCWLEVKSVEDADASADPAAPAAVTAEIGEYGYATFCCIYPLDFTSVTTATAWVATECSGEKVTMTQVEGNIYNGKGLILKSASGETASVNIPIVASSTNYYDSNLLVACLEGETVKKANSGTNYVLSVQDEKVVFAPVGDVDATVAARHCYLWWGGVSARALNLDFGDETTGINAVESGKLNVEGYYNLNGQRVAQPSKGLYIMNGKKVVVK